MMRKTIQNAYFRYMLGLWYGDIAHKMEVAVFGVFVLSSQEIYDDPRLVSTLSIDLDRSRGPKMS